jgi:hypothetical protein
MGGAAVQSTAREGSLSSWAEDSLPRSCEEEGVAMLPLRARLREAVCEARAKARQVPEIMAVAEKIVAEGLARSLRVTRRRAVENVRRFVLREVRIPEAIGTRMSAREAVLRCWPNSEAVKEALECPPPPGAPPVAEEGTRGHIALTQAISAWESERARRLARPFVAGGRDVSFKWASVPPRAAPGRIWCWGPRSAEPVEELGILLAKEARQEAIEAVTWDEVDILTPLFVVRHPVTGKARLVHDLRAVNVFMRSSYVNYERVQDVLGRGSVAAKLDLLAAFRHCRLPVEDRRRLGFAVGKNVFRWRVLPFGAAQSPELFAAALGDTIRRIRAEGIEMVIYVDDLLVVARSAAELDAAVARVFAILSEEGWAVALEKAYITVAAEQIPFLGLDVDLKDQTIRVSRAKAVKLQALCRALLQQRVVSLRDLQRLGGTLSFMAVAVPDVGLARRGINAATAEAEKLPGRTVGVKGQLKGELEFWAKSAMSLPGRTRPKPGAEWTTVVTDMSGAPCRGWGAVAWIGKRVAPDVDLWLAGRQGVEEEEACASFGQLPQLKYESSAALEVRAFREALHYLRRTRWEWVARRHIAWYCDAQTAIAAVRKWRSKSVGLLKEIRAVFALAQQLEAVIEPHWVARQCGWQPVADFLSRLAWRPATAEWALPRELVEEVLRQRPWRPDIDLFSAPGNEHLEAAATRWPTAGRYCDAFARSWDGVRGWGFPPHSQLRRVWRHLAVAQDARILVVMPAAESVPDSLRVEWMLDLPAVPLIDLEGHEPPEPMPHRLRVVDVRSPDGDA